MKKKPSCTKNLWLSLLLLALPAVVQAQFNYTTSNGAITITGCYAATNNVNIPGTINGYPVTCIANYANWSSSMTNVTIPASVTNIGPGAFGYCPALISFTVNGSNPNFASVGGVLFNKPMTTLIQYPMSLTGGYGIPGGVINIGTSAFQSCSHLTSVTIPNSVTNISDSAFNGCSTLTGVAIPDSVTNIGYSAFDFCSSMKSASIGTNVTSIGDYAFANCSGLTNATLGCGVIRIGIDAFESCSALKSVVVPNSVTNIGNWAFGYCSSLASVTLGTNVISIGQYAFGGSSLAGVSIPSSVAIIGDSAFGGCSDLNNFTVDGNNLYYASAGGVLFNKTVTTLVQYPGGLSGDYTIPNGVTNIGNYAFDYCSGLTGVTIPTGVTSLGISAFGFCYGLESITIPNTVTNIGNWAFSYCYGLTSIKIPNSVSSIGFEAFYECETLTRATIGNGVTGIGQYAFEYCTHLHQVRFLGDAPRAGNGPGSADNTVFQGETGTAFYTVNTTGWDASFGGWPTALYSSPAEDFTYMTSGGAITITGYIGSDSDVTIPLTINGCPVTAISDHAFYNQTNLTSVTILASATSIGDGAFAGCSNLSSIIVDTANPNYASAGGVLFNKTMTTLILYPAGLGGGYVISDSVTNIGNEAFNGCVGLTRVTLPGNLTSIGDGAFGYCSNLTSVTIPASVTNVGAGAFANCSSLTHADFLGDAPGVDGVAGSGDNSVFAGETGSAYYFSETAGWGTTFGGWPAVALIDPATVFTFITNADDTLTITGYIGTNSDVTIPAAINGYSVALIGDNAFFDLTNLTSVTMADSVTNIGDFAFYGCSSLTNATMGNGVTSIGQNAFNACSLLTSVTIPDSVTSLGISAFYNCSGLMNATIGNGVTDIGWWTFYNCYSLTNVTIGSRVTSIDAEAFNSCSGLANVTMPDNVTNIGDSAFYDCSGLTNVTLGGGLTSIGDRAFSYCFSLTSVTIPASVANIGAAAFGDCYGLTNIAVEEANPSFTSAGGVLFNKTVTSLVEYPTGLEGSYAIPGGVTDIGDRAFNDCSGLTSVTLPASVTSLGNDAINGCYGLTNFTVDGANLNYASAGGVLFNKPMTTLIQYPIALTGGYVIPNGVTNIGVGAFVGCSSLTAVTIPATVNTICDSTFQYCYSLTNVLIPNGVTNIGNYAFYNCYKLTSVTLPATVDSIGDAAFEYCSNLKQACFLGNAPSVNGGEGSANTSVFSGEAGTVYYASDTAGWGATFGGWPTAAGSYQCKPQILGSGGGLGVRNNKFEFTISWAANTIVVVEACTDLANPVWCPVATNTLNGGSACFSDPCWTNHPGCYYRLRSP